VAIRQSAVVFRHDLPQVLADETNDLTSPILSVFAELGEEVAQLDACIAKVGREIEGLADRDDRAHRLLTISGIGLLAASALLAAIGDGRLVRRARLLGVTKRENRYVRKLLIHAARSCVAHLDRNLSGPPFHPKDGSSSAPSQYSYEDRFRRPSHRLRDHWR